MNKRSLTKRTTRTMLVLGILLSIIAMVIGLVTYGTALINGYVDRAFETARRASSTIRHGMGVHAEQFTDDVMRIYRSLTSEQRAKLGTEEYRSYFSDIDTSEDSDVSEWYYMVNMLLSFVIDLDDVYLAVLDEDTNTVVYIVDADPDGRLYPGDWEPIPEKNLRMFLDWNGEGRLYDLDYTELYGWMVTAGYPVKGADGSYYAHMFVDIAANSVIADMARFALRMFLGMLAATLFITWFAARRIKRQVTDPIESIADAAKAYAQDVMDGQRKAHFAALDIHTGDELENLSRVMTAMEADLADSEQSIRQITAEKERAKTEMGLARRIQGSMLPHVFPPFPDRREFDIYAIMDPAREVGGDFYDFFLIDDDHLGLVMADVSGKGVPAALFMMISKVIIQSCAMLGKGAAETLTKTNEALCSSNQTDMFVTVWMGILEISTGKLTAANAGHEYPALMKDGRFELYRDRHGLVIGGMDGVQYTEYEISLLPGDKLFVYTDGLPEATDTDGQMFGTDRMLAALNDEKDAAPRQILESVRAAADAFTRGAEPFDDLTMLCLEYKGPEKDA